MENMKRNLLFTFILLALTFVFVVNTVSAVELATKVETRFNDVILDPSSTPNNPRAVVGMVGDNIPVKITFTAADFGIGGSRSDVRVKVRIEGNRDDVSASTSRFDIENGLTYTKLLNLELPSDEKEFSDVYTLYVEIVSKKERTERTYSIVIQRESYTLEVLSVNSPSKVVAGESIPVSVVVRNNGYNRADDVYVRVSIPSLGVSSQKYIGDLVPTPDDKDNEDKEDSQFTTVYLDMPEGVKEGVYTMEVSAYNDDSSITVGQLVSVKSSKTIQVLAAVKNKDLNAGETVTYDLIIVNSGDSVKVFNLNAVSGTGLSVFVPSVVTVGPKSSEVVPISVKASDSAEVGTYTFSVDVDGETVVFGANVIGSQVSASVVALTIILVIIFVVLLAVLIVLLARKEKPIEEVETSYY